MGRNRSRGHTGGGGKPCQCGHDKAKHVKRKRRCKLCDCDEYKKTNKEKN